MIFSTPHHPNLAQLHNPLLSAAFTSVVHSIATDVPNNPKQVARHLIYAMNISVYARLRPISRRFDFLMLSCNQIANRQRCTLCFRLRPAPCPPPGFLSVCSLLVTLGSERRCTGRADVSREAAAAQRVDLRSDSGPLLIPPSNAGRRLSQKSMH